jgi:hypothetical protein
LHRAKQACRHQSSGRQNPVYAQNAGGVGAGASQTLSSKELTRKKEAAGQLQAGLKMIPDGKEKYEPWKKAR